MADVSEMPFGPSSVTLSTPLLKQKSMQVGLVGIGTKSREKSLRWSAVVVDVAVDVLSVA